MVPHAKPPLSAAAARVAAQPPTPLAALQRKKKSGCFVSFLVMLGALTVCIVLAYVGYLNIKSGIEQAANQLSGWAGLVQGIDQLGDVNAIIQKYEDDGYERITGQVIVETTPIDSKRIYTCQALELNTDVNQDIAILAQVATIQGTVDGNVDFMGQALIIESDAVITGDLKSRLAQLITVKGTIEGELSGGYQALDAKPNRIRGGTTGTKDAISTVGLAIDKFKHVANEVDRQRQQLEADIQALDADVKEVVLRLRRERTPLRRGEILGQLAQLTPTDEDRDTVVKQIVPHLIHHSTDDEAAKAFKVWATKEHARFLVQVLQGNRHRVGATRNILDLLIELDARGEVVALINYYDSSVARQALEQAEAWNVDSTAIMRQCLADINTIPSHDHSLRHRLLTTIESIDSFDDTLKHEVSQSIIPLLGDSSSTSTIYKILPRTVTAADVALLIKHQPRTHESDYFELLAATQQPAAYKHIVDQAILNHAVYASYTLKNTIKHDAEQYVWPHLDNRSFIARNQAIDMLAEIGTADSIEPLSDYLSDTMSNSSAQRALKKIQSRIADN